MKAQPGRPTAITKPTVQKLEQALRDGFSIETACNLSGISRSTYYAHLQADEDFMNKMELAKSWATERAKQVVIAEINKANLKASQWWLERKARAEFSPNIQPTTQNGVSYDITNQYFGGDKEKSLGFLLRTIEALGEPTKMS